MYAAFHPRSTTLPAVRRGAESSMHTAVLAAASVMVGSFLIGILLVASLMLAGPLPVNQPEAAPLPQMLPQPSAAAGLDR